MRRSVSRSSSEKMSKNRSVEVEIGDAGFREGQPVLEQRLDQAGILAAAGQERVSLGLRLCDVTAHRLIDAPVERR
jgi:hypothetical protein